MFVNSLLTKPFVRTRGATKQGVSERLEYIYRPDGNTGPCECEVYCNIGGFVKKMAEATLIINFAAKSGARQQLKNVRER